MLIQRTLLQGLWQRLQNHHTATLLNNSLINSDTNPKMLKAALTNFEAYQAETTKADFVAKTGRTSSSMELGGTAAAAIIAPGDFALEYPIPLAPNLLVTMLWHQYCSLAFCFEPVTACDVYTCAPASPLFVSSCFVQIAA